MGTKRHLASQSDYIWPGSQGAPAPTAARRRRDCQQQPRRADFHLMQRHPWRRYRWAEGNHLRPDLVGLFAVHTWSVLSVIFTTATNSETLLGLASLSSTWALVPC